MPRVLFCFLFSTDRKKRFYGRDCCSLAVTIGAAMNLHPILLHSTRTKDKLGLLSLTKYNLSLVMGFLDEQVGRQPILPFSRAKTDFVAPPPPLPVPSATLEVHTPFNFYVWFFGVFLSWDFALWDLMFSSFFSPSFFFSFLFLPTNTLCCNHFCRIIPTCEG